MKDRRKFDAALLFYVLQIMPVPAERQLVLKHIQKKLRDNSYVVYASRYGQVTKQDLKHKVSDGYYKWPLRKEHSFHLQGVHH